MASDKKKVERLIEQLENYVETWKQFHHYIDVAKSKRVEEDDEIQFLEIKSVITQELELILAAVEFDSPSKKDIHKLIGSVTTLQALSEMLPGLIQDIEDKWHRIFIGLQAVQGLAKVQLRDIDKKKGGADVAAVRDQLESYVETWKQYKHYIVLARNGKFDSEDETEFIEIKSVITQELEIIFSAMEVSYPTREDVHGLLEKTPYLHVLAAQAVPIHLSVEKQWHQVFIGLQALVGLLKAQGGGDKKKKGGPDPEKMIEQLQNYVETWKQFNHYLGLAKQKKFDSEDETEFIEIMSVITQELEMITAEVEVESPSKGDVHSLIISTSSLYSISTQPEVALKNAEASWHKIYIGFQSVLGRLKVQHEESKKKGGWSFFGWGKK